MVRCRHMTGKPVLIMPSAAIQALLKSAYAVLGRTAAFCPDLVGSKTTLSHRESTPRAVRRENRCGTLCSSGRSYTAELLFK